MYVHRFSYPASDITVAFAGVSCNGSENHLLNCAHRQGDSCTNLEVEIFCSKYTGVSIVTYCMYLMSWDVMTVLMYMKLA